MEVIGGVSLGANASTGMFAVQPLSQPMPSVIIHRLVSSADRSKAKIIAPAAQGSVHFLNHRLHRFPLGAPLSHMAEFLADGADPLFRRARADKGSSGS